MSPIHRFLLMVALTATWSPSFLFIKLAVQEIPPLTIVALRVALASLMLIGILFWKRISLPLNSKFWFHAFMMAFFASAFPFFMFCYAEQYIESALAAILNGCTPMFTAILAQLLIPSDRMTPQKLIGVGLSAGGLFLMFAPNIASGLSGTTLGIAAGTMAAFSYALSHIYAKKYIAGQPPFVAPASQIIASTALIGPLALWFDAPLSLPFPSMAALGAIGGLALLGTVIAFIIYYKLMEYSGPTAISTVACFFPVGGMILGFLFLGETFTLGGLLAAGLILIGLMTVNDVISWGTLIRKPALQKE
jgi:drug/metabolite transporter (DMT)-like permease